MISIINSLLLILYSNFSVLLVYVAYQERDRGKKKSMCKIFVATLSEHLLCKIMISLHNKSNECWRLNIFELTRIHGYQC